MLTKDDLNYLKEKYEQNEVNSVKQRMLNKVSLIDLIQDESIKLSSDFNILVNTHGTSDQAASGRCWSFAELNILREKVIEKCSLNNFQLSGSYIAFYDKLERFHMLLERVISYKKANMELYDRKVSSLLENAMGDDGFFTQFANLVKKYGVVPRSVFHETYASSNTYEVNQILSRLLRKYYLELENSNEDEFLKRKYLEYAHHILMTMYGTPPEKFHFEYTDKNGEYHIDKSLSPQEFYEKYISLNLIDDYVEIASYQDDKIKYNTMYEVEETSRISGEKDNVVLNLSPIDFQNLIITQLKANEPVYFYCSTTSKRVDGIWIDVMERCGELFDIDLGLDRNSILKTNGLTNCHCMILTGVNTIDDEIVKWKIENSWGNKAGNQGYYIATNDWVRRYVHRIVINKKYLSPEQSDVLQKTRKKISKWDAKF